jgi:hypothetical protein
MGTVSNLVSSTPFSFNLIVSNLAPYFLQDPLESIYVTLSELKFVKLPPFKDDEGQKIEVLTSLSNKHDLPSFVSFDTNSL